MKCLSVGMCSLDTIYYVDAIPTAPGKILAQRYATAGGGMASNASVALARLGSSAEYWGRLGDDALGDTILAEMRDEGVATHNVRRIPGCVSPNAAILIGAGGECLVCAFNDPALDPDPSWLPLDAVPTFAAVLGDVRWPAATECVFDAAGKAGVPRIFDGDVGPASDLVRLAAKCDYAIFPSAAWRPWWVGQVPSRACVRSRA